MTSEDKKETGNNSTVSPRKRLDIKEAAKYLGMSVSTLRQLCYANKITYYKPVKALEFLPEDLDSYVESKRIEAKPVVQPAN